MSREEIGDTVKGSIHGDVKGQVAIGKDITQTAVRGRDVSRVTGEELAALRHALADLRARVAAEAPPGLAASAIERVDELAVAVEQDTPDLSTMEYVRNWFAGKIPILAGAVTGIVVHPIVGRLVSAAGDVVEAEFKRRFQGGSVG